MEPQPQLGPGLAGLDDGVRMARATVDAGHLPRRPGAVLEACAGVFIGNEQMAQCPRHQLPTEVEPILCPGGAWALDRAAIDEEKTPGVGQDGAA
jgi:hypothetical protein